MAKTNEANVEQTIGRTITPGTEKLVVWSGGAPCQTDYSIVFVHGFTASREALAPVVDQISRRLSANLFYTRLTGSGLGADPIGDATIDDWKNDIVEAGKISSIIGRKTIMVAMSTCNMAGYFTAANSCPGNVVTQFLAESSGR